MSEDHPVKEQSGSPRPKPALNRLKVPLQAARAAKLAGGVAAIKVIAVVVLVTLVVLILLLALIGMTAQGVPPEALCSSTAEELPPGGGVLVGASEYGGPKDPNTKGDKGSFGHLTGKMAYAELGLSGPGDSDWRDAHMIGDALGTGRALPPETKLRITANGHSVIAEKLDTGGGGPPVGSPPRPRAIDLWYQTAEALRFQGTGLVRIEVIDGGQATPLNDPNATAQASAASSSTGDEPPKPSITQNPIPFPQKRKDEMRAYAKRHYGLDTYELRDPKVIVEHFTETTTWTAAYNMFSSDVADPELHELPGTTSHFIIDQNGVIHQVLPLDLMARHTVGLNYTSIGIEMVGMSDSEILHRRPQLDAALALTRWLQWKYKIATNNVIGHNESLSSPFHRENVARLRNQTHSDWTHTDMNIFRRELNYNPPATASISNADAGNCSATPQEPTGSELGEEIVEIARSQLGQTESAGNCNPYGPCAAWCSYFATWVWRRAGVNIPSLGYSGEVYEWGQQHTRVLPPTATPAPGDAVEFGYGPKESEHIGIVERVLSDGEIVVISGNWGNAVGRSNPFQPSLALSTSGAGHPIYGYVEP